MATSPVTLAALRDHIESALATELAALSARLVAVDPALGAVGSTLVRFASDGKRLRPLLLLLGHALVGDRSPEDVMGPAIALELVHTAALIHDDVIDRAERRRGAPTVHEVFAQRHRATDGVLGDDEAFGRAIAILVGDLVLVAADDRFRAARVEASMLDRAWRRFTDLRIEVMAGQVLDVEAATQRRVDPDRALTIATLKSGRYTVARPLEIGALLAGASPAFAEALRRAGDPLGRAFQLRDDLLGVFGDPDRTGKPSTSDLAEGKRTLLVAEALVRLDPAGRADLEAGLGDAGLDHAGAAHLRALIEESGARHAVEARIESDLAEGIAALDGLDGAIDVSATEAARIDPDARAVLRGLAVDLARRQD